MPFDNLTIRGGKQLDAEGGIALGLVSALQKWADSIGRTF